MEKRPYNASFPLHLHLDFFRDGVFAHPGPAIDVDYRKRRHHHHQHASQDASCGVSFRLGGFGGLVMLFSPMGES